MEPTEAASNIRAYFTCVSRLTIVILAYIHRTCASCAAAVVLLLLLILVAPDIGRHRALQARSCHEKEEEKGKQTRKEKKFRRCDVAAKATDAAGMWQCEMCSHHKRCKAVQSVHHLLHVAAVQITKAIRVASAHI